MSGSNEGNDRDEDTDGEEMDQESVESEKSSSHSDSSGSDSDGSSDMDEEEWERRRNECIQDLADLERQFGLVKEQLYRERISQVEYKLKEVQAGKAPEYLHPLEELTNNMSTRVEVAKKLREYKVTSVETMFEAERLAAEQDFVNEQNLTKDALREDIEEKIRRLEEDRNNVDFSPDYWSDQAANKKNKRKSTDPCSDRRKKPVTVSGPYIVYQLHEEEILEDWTIFKKAIVMANRMDYGSDTAPTSLCKKGQETKTAKISTSKI